MAAFIRPQRENISHFFSVVESKTEKGERETERERETRKERDTVSTAKKEITRWFEKEQIGG
jgi:hypothetical protein